MTEKTKSGPTNRPFRDLQHLLRKKKLRLKSMQPAAADPDGEPTTDLKTDHQLFKEAMDGVVPLRRDGRKRQRPAAAAVIPPPADRPERNPIEDLHRLVETGEGFNVADTPEYREGVGPNVPPGITRHLHKGQFSIQDDIDLHGLTAAQAEETLQRFFKETVAAGKRMVLVIHGRGLSSPAKPVLKTMVHRWLAAGPWRHWVMAYSSARSCDGGAGATYVLLRERPLTRRCRKKGRPGGPKGPGSRDSIKS